MTLTLPYPPPLNNLYATVNGRRILSARGRAYKDEAGWIAKASGARPFTGDVRVQIDVYRPRRAGDLDGSLKVVLDSVTRILYEDDRQVVEIHARRFEDKRNPRVEIRVESAV